MNSGRPPNPTPPGAESARKGIKNRVTTAKELAQANVLRLAGVVKEEIAKMTALDVLQAVMTIYFEQGNFKDAAMCASQLAPYQAPRLSSVDIAATVETREPEDMSLEELSAFIQAARNDNSAEVAAQADRAVA